MRHLFEVWGQSTAAPACTGPEPRADLTEPVEGAGYARGSRARGSPDFYTNQERMLIVLQGSGPVRAGIWSRKALINESIQVRGAIVAAGGRAPPPPARSSAPRYRCAAMSGAVPAPFPLSSGGCGGGSMHQAGSILPYLDDAVAAGYSYMVLNPNENTSGAQVNRRLTMRVGPHTVLISARPTTARGAAGPLPPFRHVADSRKRVADPTRRLRLEHVCVVRGLPWAARPTARRVRQTR